MKKLLIACLLSFLPVSAKIIYVSPAESGTADGSSFENSIGTIQSGLNAAVSGDTLLLNSGKYPEPFLIGASLTRITISSQYLSTHDSSHIATTIIDCQSRNNGNMISSYASLDTTSAFIGITFQDLPDAGFVTSVYCDATAATGPKFRRCHFLRNDQCFGNGDILVDSCFFSYNTDILLSNDGSLQLRNCIIEKSSGYISTTKRLSVSKCEIRDNKPANWLFSGHYKFFDETIFTGNGDSSTSTPISYFGGTFDTTVFNNCVFSNNTAENALFRDIFGVTFIGCKFYNNTITGEDGGLFYTCRNIQLRNCLIYANSGLIIDNQFSEYLATISGTTIADNDVSGIIRNFGTLKITNSIITDSISSKTDAYYSLLKINPEHLTSSSNKCIINRNPLFVNATAGDYHLMGYSPAIDAGSRDSSNLRENQHCYYTNDNQIIDMGYYGNTPEATCKKKSNADMTIIGDMRPNLYLNEVVYDTLIVKNASATDTIVTYDNDSVTSSIEGLTCTGVLLNYTVLKPGDSCFAYFRHEGKPGGNGGGYVNFGFNANPSSRQYYYSGTVSSKNFDDIFQTHGYVPLQ